MLVGVVLGIFLVVLFIVDVVIFVIVVVVFPVVLVVILVVLVVDKGFLRKKEFIECTTKHEVYVRRSMSELIKLYLYVDDLFTTSSCKKEIEEFKDDMSKEFEISDLGNILYFLSIEFYKSSRGLMLHQRTYASEILKIFEMEGCNVTSKPVETRLQLTKDPDENKVDPTQYRRLIGLLRSLCHTIPDLAYNVVDEAKECKLVGYIDLSWCGDFKDRKSTTGYVFMLGGASISWNSRKEPVVSLSSCEAEYIIASLCECQATWMVNFIDEITRKNHRASNNHVEYEALIAGIRLVKEVGVTHLLVQIGS
ncbi:uncharacterized mitochondrial protein AtMg00810-like [Lathyrus oleraceus]|uniref:uncharacterized mitochondrial protein AtMg00810-like n=1 Tax=Pisum sativum TaxID=3888 RepID=UPI0021D11D21|nr:uncharacterized mitochondrial protein AtMg00810-like [Pisum sativum]